MTINTCSGVRVNVILYCVFSSFFHQDDVRQLQQSCHLKRATLCGRSRGPARLKRGGHVTCADLERASEHEIFISFCINLKPAASWETNGHTGPSSETAFKSYRSCHEHTSEHAHTHKTEGAGLQSYEKITFHK